MLCTSENLDNQDFEFLNILQNLHKSSDYIETSAEGAEKKTNDSVKKKSVTTDESRFSGCYCSETVFKLRDRAIGCIN